MIKKVINLSNDVIRMFAERNKPINCAILCINGVFNLFEFKKIEVFNPRNTVHGMVIYLDNNSYFIGNDISYVGDNLEELIQYMSGLIEGSSMVSRIKSYVTDIHNVKESINDFLKINLDLNIGEYDFFSSNSISYGVNTNVFLYYNNCIKNAIVRFVGESVELHFSNYSRYFDCSGGYFGIGFTEKEAKKDFLLRQKSLLESLYFSKKSQEEVFSKLLINQEKIAEFKKQNSSQN